MAEITERIEEEYDASQIQVKKKTWYVYRIYIFLRSSPSGLRNRG